MNIQKRLKHTDGGGVRPERKEYGANDLFRKNKNFQKEKNRKNQKMGFLYACACVKDEKLSIFPDVDAVKRQEMPNLPLFSVSDGFKLENGIVIGCWQNKRSGWLKNDFLLF